MSLQTKLNEKKHEFEDILVSKNEARVKTENMAKELMAQVAEKKKRNACHV